MLPSLGGSLLNCRGVIRELGASLCLLPHPAPCDAPDDNNPSGNPADDRIHRRTARLFRVQAVDTTRLLNETKKKEKEEKWFF